MFRPRWKRIMKTSSLPLWFKTAFALIALGILAGGYRFYDFQGRYMLRQAEEALLAVANLKVAQIAAWRNECLADAAMLMSSPLFLAGGARDLSAAVAENKDAILASFRVLKANHHYSDVILVALDGRVYLSLSGRTERTEADAVSPALSDAWRSRRPVFDDLHTCDSSPHISVIAPIVAADGQTEKPIGAVILVSEAREYLFPLIQSWPASGRTAETILVRREGEEVLFLSDLRYQPGAALRLTIPLSRGDVPAVMAVLGKEGIVNGQDYRGAKVLSAIKAVPDSPWFVVVKVDEAEALAVWHSQSIRIMLLGLGYLGLLTALVAMAWLRKRKEHYQAYDESEEACGQAEERFRIAAETSSDLIYEWDLKQDIQWFGDIDKLLGYEPGEFPRTMEGFAAALHPEDKDRVVAAIQAHLENRAAYAEEYRIRRKDGAYRLWTARGKAARAADGKPVRWVGTVTDITERKQAAENIEIFANAVESAFDCIMLTDGQGNITYGNKSALETFGYTAEEILKLNVADLDADPEIHKNVMRSMAVTGKWSGEVINVNKSMGKFHSLLSACIINDDKGNPRGTVGILRNITELKRAQIREQLARDCLDLLNRLSGKAATIRDILSLIKKALNFEAVGIRLKEGDDFPYYETDGFPEEFLQAERYLCERSATGEIVRDEQGNPVLECMCGNVLCGRTDPARPFFTGGGSFWTNSTTNLLASTTEKDRRARTRNRCHGDGYESVALIPLRAGDEIIGLLQINDHRRDQFTPEMIRFFEGLGASVGIALSRQRAGDDLKLKNAMLTTQQEASIDGILVVNENGRIITYNRRFADMWGIPSDILESRSDQRALQTVMDKLANPEEFISKVEQLYKNRHEISRDEIGLKDGRTFDRYSAPMFDTDGKYYGRVWYFRDMTERKQIQTALELSNIALIHRNLELQNFYHIVSHELKTPLTSAREFTSIMLDGIAGPLTDDQKQYLQMIRESCDQLQFCVKDLLEATRLETGKLELNLVDTSMETLAANVVDAITPATQAKGIDLRRDIDPALASVPLDARRINQVCLNLLSNALKYTPAGGVVTLRICNDPQDPELIRFSVSDTGLGIAPEHLDRIFDKLYQVRETDTSPEGGMGLGLYIASEIVRLHNGRIWVESTVGHGSTFYFTLPKRLRQIRHHVLFVDDDEFMQKGVRGVLEQAGIEVSVASDGVAALEMVRRHPVDLAIVDLCLPGMSSTVLMRELRKGKSDLPLLLYTGNPDNPLMKQAMEISPLTLLIKAGPIENLIALVRSMLEARAASTVRKPDLDPHTVS